MKIPKVKGTRDYYPDLMARRNWIVDNWKRISLRNGFVEYDGPIFEYLKMFQIKSGDEIVEQLFSLKDRGGRDLAIRPEITPTLARMVNQKISSLPRPIKWFSVPRLCRAERPQKGRLREFFQWNIDIIGVEDVLADAEVIFTTIDYLRDVGFTPHDVHVEISSRKLLSAALANLGIEEKQLPVLYPILDKFRKVPEDTFREMIAEKVSDPKQASSIVALMNTDTLPDVSDIAGSSKKLDAAIQDLARLQDLLQKMGVWKYCELRPGIVRGLAYYTGIVFEVYELGGELRAIAGGGRFDNLLKDFGGPDIPATGMGMGDCVLEIALAERGLLKSPPARKLDYFVCYADPKFLEGALQVIARLRAAGYRADFSYKGGGLGKQLKAASAAGAAQCVIIGEEFKHGKLAMKDMATGRQTEVDKDRFMHRLQGPNYE